MVKVEWLTVNRFQKEVTSVHSFILTMEGHITAVGVMVSFFKTTKDPRWKKLRPLLTIKPAHKKQLYELGFIALFAAFESFMFYLAKEVLKKYPATYISEKLVSRQDIEGLTTLEEIEDYFIDSYAIYQSQSIKTWNNFLQGSGIYPFKKAPDEEQLLQGLSLLRNLLVHSSGKTTSRFKKEAAKIKFLKTPVPLGTPFDLDRKKYYKILRSLLLEVIDNLQHPGRMRKTASTTNT